MDFEKLENEIGAEHLEKVMESMLDVLCEGGSPRALLYRETRNINLKMRKIVDSIFDMNEEQLEQATKFLKQINNLLDDYMKEKEK